MSFARLDEVVALKRLKMEKEREGFPITSLREVSTLLKAHHPNIVRVQVSFDIFLQLTSRSKVWKSKINELRYELHHMSVVIAYLQKH